MKIPYGIADYYALRTEGHVYVDRTGHIPTIEELGKSLLFLRPRRFGKTLWLRTLACYYDLRYADEHERLFGGLAIAGNETPLAHRYFVLEWDFSKINPDPPPRGVNVGVASRHERIGNEIHSYLNGSITSFVSDFRERLPQNVEIDEGDAFRTLNNLLAAIRQTPYKLDGDLGEDGETSATPASAADRNCEYPPAVDLLESKEAEIRRPLCAEITPLSYASAASDTLRLAEGAGTLTFGKGVAAARSSPPRRPRAPPKPHRERPGCASP